MIAGISIMETNTSCAFVSQNKYWGMGFYTLKQTQDRFLYLEINSEQVFGPLNKYRTYFWMPNKMLGGL